MNYKEVKTFRSRPKTSSIDNLIERFLEDNIKAAEITEYEDRYSSAQSVYSALRNAIKKYYAGKIRCAKQGEHIYIENLLI